MASWCSSILNGKLAQHVKNLGVLIILHLTIFVSLNLLFSSSFFPAVLLTWCICIFQIIYPTPWALTFLFFGFFLNKSAVLRLCMQKSFQTWITPKKKKKVSKLEKKNKSKTMKICSFELPNAFLLWPHPLTLHSGVINPSAGFSNFTDFSHLKTCILLSQFTTISWVLLHGNQFY